MIPDVLGRRLLRGLLGLWALSAASCYGAIALLASHEIDRGGGHYTAFPSLYSLSDDRTLALVVTARYRTSHHDGAGAKVQLISTDCGLSWQQVEHVAPARVFADGPRDTYSIISANGWRSLKPGEPIPPGANTWREGGRIFVAQGVVQRTTVDAGRNWAATEELNVPEHALLMNYNVSSHLRTSDGTKLAALYFKKSSKARDRVLVAVKRRRQADWDFVEMPLGDDSRIGFNETALVQLPDGRIAALMRPDPESIDFLYLSISADEGRTWTKPVRTAIKGYPASAVMHRDELVVTVADRRSKPMSIVAYFLDAKTLSVDTYMTLDTANGNPRDFGYPVSVACGDAVVTTYYVPGPRNSAYSKVMTWKH